MTHQSNTRHSRRPLGRAAVRAAHEEANGKNVAMVWCDSETGERIRIEVAGTREWLERLLSAGFVLIEGDPSGEGLAPNRLAALNAPEAPVLALEGNRTGVPGMGPSSGSPPGTPSSIAG